MREIRRVKAGRRQESCAGLQRALEDLRRQRADCLLLGCTELPIAFKQSQLGARSEALPTIDPTDLLARACVDAARGSGASLRGKTV